MIEYLSLEEEKARIMEMTDDEFCNYIENEYGTPEWEFFIQRQLKIRTLRALSKR